jgi:integrase
MFGRPSSCLQATAPAAPARLENAVPATPYAAITTIPTPDGLVYVRKTWASKQQSFLLVLDGPTPAISLLLPDWRPRSPTSTRTQVTPPQPATLTKEIQAFAETQIPIWMARASGRKPVSTNLVTVADCIAATEQAISSTIRPSSLAAYRKQWKRVGKFIPISTHLRNLTREKVQGMISKLAARGAAATSIHNAVTALHRALGPAIEVGAVHVSIFQHLSMPRPVARPRQHLSREHRNRLLDTASAYSPDIKLLFSIGLLAGLRRAELLALRWSDIRWDEKVIVINNSADFTTKNGKNRSVPISDHLLAILTEAMPADASPSSFVLMPDKKPRGRKMRWAFAKSFKTVATQAGVPWMTPHAMRRCFSTLAVQAGVSIWKLKNWLGHGSVAVTEKAYCHDQSTFDADVNKVG